MDERAAPFLLAPGATRRDDAILPFKVCAADTAGALSVCEFRLGPWESGPVLHLHASVDEAFYVVAGTVLAQLGDERLEAPAGAFVWVPRGTPHTFANAVDEPLHVLAIAAPGGIEEFFAEQAAYLSSAGDEVDAAAMKAIGERHGAPTLGPPIRVPNAPD